MMFWIENKPFQTKKRLKFYLVANLIFPKGLVHDFGLFNNLKFLHVSFFVKRPRKSIWMCPG